MGLEWMLTMWGQLLMELSVEYRPNSRLPVRMEGR